jgi:glycosyltransferase involved in cell wall biosynthesis
VFAVGDVEGMARLITRFTSEPQHVDRAMARRESILARYDWNAVATRTLQLYERITNA